MHTVVKVFPFSADNDAEKVRVHRYRDTSLILLTFGGKKKLEFDPGPWKYLHFRVTRLS